ncbi:hypothetical protein [Caulobacter sp. UNC279MFTsu5.1]|uniref:HAAS signaling domain-containing protein n=1 Tax=Caulobacter sp. UNC279MFTsu5.1 TaxID=1502775 RepID=UPI00036143C7|nr:hypothetical protein [Caulobacter sp. UNC279MFTsu5.1]SFI72076.1 hypothetical protein SAMN02799626_00434 [Caulobacter sp. UNC279MFTsu5.1]
MDLLDRYLAAVAALLPKAQREDIVAELRDILLTQMEEKEAELGRPLDAREREAVLKAFGHPIAVAGRFGTPRALIGPELYPFYAFGVKALLVVAAVASAIPVVIGALTDPGGAGGGFARFLSSFLATGLTMIGAATVLGAGIERGWIPLGGAADWRVADLPRLDALAPRRRGLPRKGPRQRRFEALLEVILTALFILWWTGLVPAPWASHVANSDMVLRPAPIWAALYWPLLAWAGVQLASSLIGLLRPGWVRARAALEVVCGLAGLALAVVLWRAGRLVVVGLEGAGGSNADGVAGLQTALDLSFHLTATVMIAVLTIKIAVELWRLFRGAGPAPA